MKKDMKYKLSQTLGSKDQLNKKALQIKKSWDEVEGLLKNVNKPKKK